MKCMLKLPGLSSWVECCYSTESHLLFGDHSLLSCYRVQQGDPLGPCSAWYLDDGTVCGTPQDLNIALKIIEEEGLPRELCLNHHKSLPYISLGDDICNKTLPNKTLPSDIPITSSGFCLLGSPIGSDYFHVASILDRIAKIWRALG